MATGDTLSTLFNLQHRRQKKLPAKKNHRVFFFLLFYLSIYLVEVSDPRSSAMRLVSDQIIFSSVISVENIMRTYAFHALKRKEGKHCARRITVKRWRNIITQMAYLLTFTTVLPFFLRLARRYHNFSLLLLLPLFMFLLLPAVSCCSSYSSCCCCCCYY